MIGTGDVSVTVGDDFVATVEWHRPPNNHFDLAMIRQLADALDDLDSNPACRVVVLCSEGKHFCAGANLSGNRELREATQSPTDSGHLYREAARIFSAKTPLVAAVQGAAVGGGLGLAMAADFRIASDNSFFSANFARLGLHHGFALTTTLPAVIGQQRAWEMLYTGRRVLAAEAASIGLCDRLAESASLRLDAHAFAAAIAESAPLAVRAIRDTMRRSLTPTVADVMDRERTEQERLVATSDFREGVRATADRRNPRFAGE